MADELQHETTAHFLDYWRIIRDRKEVVIAVFLLTTVVGTIYTFMIPNRYSATAKIEMRLDNMDVSVFSGESSAGPSPYWIMTQERVMRSKPVLDEVIRNLNLLSVWGAEYNEDKSPLTRNAAMSILQRSIRIQPERDTTIMNISASTKTPQLSADIANELGRVYRDLRLQVGRKRVERAIDALSNEVQKQKEKVELAEEELERIRQEEGIHLLGHDRFGSPSDAQQIVRLESDRISARVDMLVRKARLDELNELEGDALMEASAYIVADATLAGLRRTLIDSQVQLNLMLENGIYGAQHPDVLRMQGAVNELKIQIAKALNGLKAGLNADYEVARQKYLALDEELKIMKDANIVDQGSRYLPFTRAARNLQVQQDILTALRARITQTGIEIEVPRTGVEIVEAAEPPSRPSSPNIPINILLSTILGVLAGVGLAFFVEYLDVSLKTVDEVEKYLGVSILAVIPQQAHPLIQVDGAGGHTEAYRSLRTNLFFSTKSDPKRLLTVTSGGVGEGKSTTLFNLAQICAEQGDKVLVVDADLRRPTQHKMLGLSNRTGVVNVLSGEMTVEEAIVATNRPNLFLLPSGRLRRGSLGIINNTRLRALIDEVKGQYDFVLFDSPPIWGVTDASIIASEVDGVLLVVQYRKYPKIISLRAKRMIENAGGTVVGAVLNNINVMRDDYYYYYHATTEKYYSSERKRRAKKTAADEVS